MKIRIDKMLSNVGLGTRKQIKQDAKNGSVKINDEIVKDSSKIIDTDKDEVKYKNEIVKYVQFIYLMMNKPAGVVSATEDNYDETVIDLLSSEYRFYEPFPVGRLDKDTEGLLIITNDGQLTHDLLSPKKHVDKTYYAEIDDIVTEEDIIEFEEGVILNDGYKTMPAKLKVIENGYASSKCLITIKEGKFHQIKRMFIAVNKEVTYLKRLSMGNLELDETLELGEYRHLTEQELKILRP
jgi:16S rRNA pseudouridine516 synthase